MKMFYHEVLNLAVVPFSTLEIPSINLSSDHLFVSNTLYNPAHGLEKGRSIDIAMRAGCAAV